MFEQIPGKASVRISYWSYSNGSEMSFTSFLTSLLAVNGESRLLRPCIKLFNHYIHSFAPPFIYSFILAFVHSFIYLCFTLPFFFRSSVRSFVRSFFAAPIVTNFKADVLSDILYQSDKNKNR